jgi:hypothetical protein
LNPAAKLTVGAGDMTLPATASPAAAGPTKIPVALDVAPLLVAHAPPLHEPEICMLWMSAGPVKEQPLVQLLSE